MCKYQFVCHGSYVVQLVLQRSVFHVAVDETHGFLSLTEAQQIYDVLMSEPEHDSADHMTSHDEMVRQVILCVEAETHFDSLSTSV